MNKEKEGKRKNVDGETDDDILSEDCIKEKKTFERYNFD